MCHLSFASPTVWPSPLLSPSSFFLIYTIPLHIFSFLFFLLSLSLCLQSLTLSSKSRQDKTVGEIVNLMSVDAQRFMDVTNYIHLIWSAPFQILVALLLLYLSMGVSVFAGFGVMLLFIPLNMFTGSLIRRFQILQMIKKDLRIKIVNEVLNGIKVYCMCTLVTFKVVVCLQSICSISLSWYSV